MKLLVVTQYFYPENFRVNELVSDLVKRGHEVTVLTGMPNYPQGRFFPGYGWRGPRREQFEGATVIRTSLIPRGNGGAVRLILNYASFALFASLAALWRLPRQDAIFVFEVSPVTVGIPAIVASWRHKAPILFWVLDLWPQSLQATGTVRAAWALKLVERGVRWIYSRCALILGQSRSFLDSIGELGTDPSRLRYFPNWIEAEYTQAVVPAVKPGRGEFRIVYAGNIGVAQDFPAIIEAAGQLAKTTPGTKWVLAGDGRMAPWVKAEISKRGLDQQFELLGQLPASRMPELFAGADVLLVALRADPVFSLTIPGKLQSYMASGKPILAMIDGEAARVVQEAGAGLVAPAGDATCLARFATQLAAMSPEELTAMGLRAREYATREFGRELLIDQLECWLQEAVQDYQRRTKNDYPR
ncbi:glycosyltransferase family 4 protein [Herbaspirillum seropedicae]|uniref:glycosyltransferase family 4 protein n=1 Tax=Herbaspirillum seropedicae TaxID=964 RepID=UPI0031E42A2F